MTLPDDLDDLLAERAQLRALQNGLQHLIRAYGSRPNVPTFRGDVARDLRDLLAKSRKSSD